MMNIAIASYAFHGLLRDGKMDLFGYLESCAYRYHLRTADIWNGFLLSTEDDYLAKVKEALVERGLVLTNLCVDGAHLWEDDPAVRDQHYQNALAALHAAEVLGALTIRIDAGGREDVWTNEQFDYIVMRYREYVQRAYDGGYRVGPENHWGTENIPANMIMLCEAISHPAFGVLLHFKDAENDAALAPWAMHTHISWAISEGPLEERMALLRDAGYGGYYSIEHHSGQNEYTEVAAQVAKVQEVLHRWYFAG